jgi:hypothetical protein
MRFVGQEMMGVRKKMIGRTRPVNPSDRRAAEKSQRPLFRIEGRGVNYNESADSEDKK